MNTQQLETFVQVAENLNFARAAEALNITQSAVSRQIHALEDELGAKLLHRTTRTVTLTPAGISFLTDAKHIIGRLKFAVGKIQHQTDSDIQILSIGCGNDAHLEFLHKALSICHDEIPAFHPFLRIISHRSLLNLFYQGEIEVLAGFRNDIPVKGGIIFNEISRLSLCCVLPRSHPYANKEKIYQQELLSESLVTCSSYAIPGQAIEYQNRIAEYMSPEAVHPCDNPQAALALVRAGYGYSILPESRFHDDGLCYIPLADLESEPLSCGLFYKKGASNPLLKKFISIAEKV